MPRTISDELKAHLAGEVTTICTCWQITRQDTAVYYFTDLDINLTFDGNVYEAAFYSRTAIASDAGMSVDNLELTGIFDSNALQVADLRAGLFDFARIEMFAVNYEDLTQGKLNLRRGYLGEVSASPSGVFTAELRGMTQMLANSMGELYTATCKAVLGDARCKVPLEPPVVARSTDYVAGLNPNTVRVAVAGFSDSRRYGDVMFLCTTPGTTAASAPAYDATVGHTTTDGTAVFTCQPSWTRAGVVSTAGDNEVFGVSLIEPRAVVGWYTEGTLVWESGLNTGRSMEIRGWDPAGFNVRLFIPMPRAVAAGDRFRISPGCDRLLATCRDKFNNIVNMRATPFIPGNDVLLRVPVQ